MTRRELYEMKAKDIVELLGRTRMQFPLSKEMLEVPFMYYKLCRDGVVSEETQRLGWQPDDITLSVKNHQLLMQINRTVFFPKRIITGGTRIVKCSDDIELCRKT